MPILTIFFGGSLSSAGQNGLSIQNILNEGNQMKSSILTRSLLVIGILALAACNKKQPEASNQMAQQNPGVIAAHDINAVAGIKWTRPERWGVDPPRQMRVATYTLPAAEGDAEGGECAVFYFGTGQGGDLNANIERWVNQFEDPGKPEQSTEEVGGMKVTLVKVTGTYLSPSGPMMQSSGKKENYRLMGAIVDGPEGMVFFKATGPAKTMEDNEKGFDSLVNSLSKQ
jgi:hypothetical protein